MHVQGNLNIVGTAIDDDGVDLVEMKITRGNSEKGELIYEHRADGKDFWSYFLDTSDTAIWTDGIYTVTSWATDVNGLSGISETFPVKSHRKHSVVWNLDRKKPEINVTSHELGALVSGKVSIKGNVWDGNGISSLSYSVDNGGKYVPVNLKYDKGTDKYYFDFQVETNALEDGPAVVLFRARDGMKTEGVLSFLVFANNTGPEVEILYPDPAEAVCGIFTIAGYASHRVGLTSLTWKIGKDGGDIPVVVGNPWWVQEIDIRGQNVRSLDLEVRAVDVSGNATVAKRKLNVDQDAGLPKVSLAKPKAGDVIGPEGLMLVGLAEDIIGVESIIYSIDGKQAKELECSGYFQFVVDEELSVGAHTLDIYAKNINGDTGRGLVLRKVKPCEPA
jgi:hypothetical protein